MSASVPSNHADDRTHGLLVGCSVPAIRCASIEAMLEERRIRTRTPEWRATYDRIHVALELTSRLNALRFSDTDSRTAVLRELVGKPLPETAIVHPPFYCTYGLGIELGERSFVGQGCTFLDLGGITVGDRAMISPRVTLVTEGHPVEPGERYDYITVAPIVIEANVWIGAAATVLPGVRIGHDSVVGAGAVVAKDVPPLTVVTGAGYVERKNLVPVPSSST
jgi:acetyltransferase-like isoleucine patch superfamily enzyme